VGKKPGPLRRLPRLLRLPHFSVGADTDGPGELHYQSPVHVATVVFTAHPRSASRVASDRVRVQDQPAGAHHLVPAGTEFWTAWHEEAAWAQLTVEPAALWRRSRQNCSTGAGSILRPGWIRSTRI
jgi:hypothetical protein